MSRFSHLLPFSPLYDFQVCRVVTINGVEYVPGDRMATEARDALGERRLRQMYERRQITPIAPEVLPALVQAGPVEGTVVEMDGEIDEAADGDPIEKQAVDGVMLPPPDLSLPPVEANAAGMQVVHKGFGRWYVVAADGTEQGPMTKEQAEAQVAA